MSLRRLVISALAAASAGLLVWRLPVERWLIALVDTVRDAGAAGVALFFLAYVISSVILLPGSLLTLGAGLVYGPLWGLAIASPASVAGATAAFVLGRTLLRSRVERWVASSPRLQAVDRAVTGQGFRLVALLRLSPLIPFNALNYALSITGVPLGGYMLASFLGMLPGTWLYVYLGSLATTATGLSDAASGGGPWRTTLLVLGLAGSIIAVVVVTRAARRALDEELARTERGATDGGGTPGGKAPF